tara:strand:- start:499 stop:1461 length:963 start_codon:yes stop_codon:yes gene_type:complete
MGIKMLNQFLRNTCDGNINIINLSSLAGKTIVIDTSIYLYRYISEGNLIENFYYMISLFKHNNIRPIFIFDGKPKEIKKHVIEQRNTHKIKAEEEYNKLIDTLSNKKLTYIDKIRIEEEIFKIKRRMIRVRWEHIDSVKCLMDAYGINYIVAPHEADELCVRLVVSGIAYGCMSEDMDMFAYGCPIVLRYLSLINSTVVIYDLNKLLNLLEMNLTDFKYLCILSGTDYNNNMTNIYVYYKLYLKYKKQRVKIPYLEYIIDSSSDKLDIENIVKLYYMFDIYNRSYNYLSIYDDYKYVDKELDMCKLNDILKGESFIFLDN